MNTERTELLTAAEPEEHINCYISQIQIIAQINRIIKNSKHYPLTKCTFCTYEIKINNFKALQPYYGYNSFL